MDITAVLIASLSLVVSGLALGWQIAMWLLNGPRVRLRLKQGVLGPGGAALATVGRRGRPQSMTSMRSQGWSGPDVLAIEVTNIGRTKVKVVRYGLTLHRGKMALNYMAETQGPDLPHWLEPGESETWYADLRDGQALMASTRSTLDRRAHGVHMTIGLGTGKEMRTRRFIKI